VICRTKEGTSTSRMVNVTARTKSPWTKRSEVIFNSSSSREVCSILQFSSQDPRKCFRAEADAVDTLVDDYPFSDSSFSHCSSIFLTSTYSRTHWEYVVQGLIRYLLTENGVPGLHFATTILLYDSQSNEETYNLLMKEEGIIHKLTADLMQGDAGSDNRLQEAVLRLLFEMTRVQRVDPQALGRCAEVTGWRTASTN
jgi:hypothetical protein